jgi:hypothetical protein
MTAVYSTNRMRIINKLFEEKIWRLLVLRMMVYIVTDVGGNGIMFGFQW